MTKRQFHANLTHHNHQWIQRQAEERGISMNDVVNEIISETRKKLSIELVQNPCIESSSPR